MRWLTGFAFLRGPNANSNAEAEADTDCRMCAGAVEKADHLLRECPALDHLREECFGTSKLAGNDRWEISSLVKFLSDESIKSLEDPEEPIEQGDYTSEEEELR